jgi:hypothetical protein
MDNENTNTSEDGSDPLLEKAIGSARYGEGDFYFYDDRRPR